jgi:DNA-nicking Smr family endonuclease
MCARGARLDARLRQRNVGARGPAPPSRSSDFELEDEAGTLRGWRPDLDRRLLRKLRSGALRATARLDLHGSRLEEAHALLVQFLETQSARGTRAVLVICGRGTHSPEGEGVLRAKIGSWLTEGSASRGVLGFTSARPEEGGDGAIYVLLRS